MLSLNPDLLKDLSPSEKLKLTQVFQKAEQFNLVHSDEKAPDFSKLRGNRQWIADF